MQLISGTDAEYEPSNLFDFMSSLKYSNTFRLTLEAGHFRVFSNKHLTLCNLEDHKLRSPTAGNFPVSGQTYVEDLLFFDLLKYFALLQYAEGHS